MRFLCPRREAPGSALSMNHLHPGCSSYRRKHERHPWPVDLDVSTALVEQICDDELRDRRNTCLSTGYLNSAGVRNGQRPKFREMVYLADNLTAVRRIDSTVLAAQRPGTSG